MHVSAQMRRRYESDNSEAAAAKPKSDYVADVASQIGNEVRFKAQKKTWFYSEKGQASGKQEIEKLRFHSDKLGVASQLALVTVENAAGENELHFDPLTLKQ
jgi:hypothetical protein